MSVLEVWRGRVVWRRRAAGGEPAAVGAARRRRGRVLALLACLPLLAAAPTDTAAPDRWTPPVPRRSAAFTTLDVTWSNGSVSTAVLPESLLPLRFTVERQVTDALGLTEVTEALQGWNGIPGSRFSALVAGLADTGARTYARDGVNRVFVESSCSGDHLAVAHLTTIWPNHRYGVAGGYTTDVDIGVCPQLLAAPERTRSVILHEVGHAMGLGHADAGCRVMSARTAPSCSGLTDADRDSARYLYPALPRLAGPSRLESSARTSFATRESDGAARTVVLADAFGGSALPVATAAVAGALGVPMLLAGPDCTAGATGQELRRLAASDATVVVAGGGLGACAAALRAGGWKVTELGGVEQVASHLAAARDVATIFVVRGPTASGDLPDGITAAAAAARLGAPVLFSDGDRLAAATRAFLDRHPSVRQAIIVGGESAVPPAVADELARRGVVSRRYAGEDRIGTALAVASIPDAFLARSPLLLVAADKWADAVSGSATGGALGWPVLLTWGDALDARVATYIREHATGGYVVGGAAAVSDAVHVAASALVPS